MTELKNAVGDTQICLCMLVKNSGEYIVKTLDSIILPLRHRIGFCVIVVDSLTSDKSEDIVRKYFFDHKMPHRVEVAKWVSYSHNRNLAMDLCEVKENACEYIWMNDADDPLVGVPIIPSKLTKKSYWMKLSGGDTEPWTRPVIIKRGYKDVRYERRVHEYLTNVSTPGEFELIQGDYYIYAVASPHSIEKGRSYIALLEEDLKDFPDDPRSLFYIGQTYYENREFDKALEYYKRRAKLDGFVDDKFFSLYRGALCEINLGKESWATIMEHLLETQQHSPERYEPLARIAWHYAQEAKWQLAYRFASWGLSLPRESGKQWQMFSDYDYYLQDVMALSAINIGKLPEAMDAVSACLNSTHIPLDQRPRLLGYMDIIAKETKLAATAPLNVDELQQRLNLDNSKAALQVKMIPQSELLRSVVRCTYLDDGPIHLRIKFEGSPVQTGSPNLVKQGSASKGSGATALAKQGLELTEHEAILLAVMKEEKLNMSIPMLMLPEGYYCSQLWHPVFYLEFLKKIGAHILVLTAAPDISKPPIYDSKLHICYYVEEVNKNSIKNETPRLVLCKKDLRMANLVKVCYLAHPIFYKL